MSIGPKAPDSSRRSTTWHDVAACRDLDVRLFFPEEGAGSPLALAVCRRCPVRAACLAEALSSPGILGIWGGTTEQQRRRLRRAPAETRPRLAGPHS
jgi:WhiB family redox-sensing transcriptional regulator